MPVKAGTLERWVFLGVIFHHIQAKPSDPANCVFSQDSQAWHAHASSKRTLSQQSLEIGQECNISELSGGRKEGPHWSIVVECLLALHPPNDMGGRYSGQIHVNGVRTSGGRPPGPGRTPKRRQQTHSGTSETC